MELHLLGLAIDASAHTEGLLQNFGLHKISRESRWQIRVEFTIKGSV